MGKAIDSSVSRETTDEAGTETTDEAGTETTDEAGTETTDEAGTETTDEAGSTFTREYVEGLRTESAGHRTALRTTEQQRDELRATVHTLRLSTLGILADPTDLPYKPEFDDPTALEQAARDLVAAKPHLRARRAGGDVGQEQEGAGGGLGVSLADMLRAGA